MRGTLYKNDKGESARLCNGGNAVVIKGRFGDRFICAKKLNGDELLKERGFRPIAPPTPKR